MKFLFNMASMKVTFSVWLQTIFKDIVYLKSSIQKFTVVHIYEGKGHELPTGSQLQGEREVYLSSDLGKILKHIYTASEDGTVVEEKGIPHQTQRLIKGYLLC